MPYLTREMIFAGATHPTAGGWGRAQVELLGHTEFPPKKGWVSALRGKLITDEDYAKFLSLKSAHRNKKQPKPSANSEPLHSEAYKALLAYINSTPELLSLLYDLDLMPEQCEPKSLDRNRMMLLTRWHQIKNQSEPTITEEDIANAERGMREMGFTPQVATPQKTGHRRDGT